MSDSPVIPPLPEVLRWRVAQKDGVANDVAAAGDALCDLVERQQEELRRAQDVHEAAIAGIRMVEAEPSHIKALIEGDGVKVVAMLLAEIVREKGGANYCEMQLQDPTSGQFFAVCIQRPEGKTPHMLRQEAEARALEAERQRDAARDDAALEREVSNAMDGQCRSLFADLEAAESRALRAEQEIEVLRRIVAQQADALERPGTSTSSTLIVGEAS